MSPNRASDGPLYKSWTILIELLQAFSGKRYNTFRELNEIVYLFEWDVKHGPFPLTSRKKQRQCECNAAAVRLHELAFEEFLGPESVEDGEYSDISEEDANDLPPYMCEYHKDWDAVNAFAVEDGTATRLKELCFKLEKMHVKVKLESRRARWVFRK